MVLDLRSRVSFARGMNQHLLDEAEQEVILEPLPMLRPFDLAIFPLGIVADVCSGLVPWQFCNGKIPRLFVQSSSREDQTLGRPPRDWRLPQTRAVEEDHDRRELPADVVWLSKTAVVQLKGQAVVLLLLLVLCSSSLNGLQRVPEALDPKFENLFST